MTPRIGDIVRIVHAICGVDLRGELAEVCHLFDRHGVRWLVLEPWIESWSVDHVILQPDAVEVVASSEGVAT